MAEDEPNKSLGTENVAIEMDVFAQETPTDIDEMQICGSGNAEHAV